MKGVVLFENIKKHKKATTENWILALKRFPWKLHWGEMKARELKTMEKKEFAMGKQVHVMKNSLLRSYLVKLEICFVLKFFCMLSAENLKNLHNMDRMETRKELEF